jgi:hypothetical protein
MPPISPTEPDFGDDGVINQILVDGTDVEMEKLRQHIESREKKPIPMQLLEKFRFFARLRRDAIKESDAATKERKKNNPRATAEEVSLGAYVERLEPQTREAVLALRRKGYPTFESGFSSFDVQNVRFEQDVPELKDFVAPSDLAEMFSAHGATLGVMPNRVWFSFSRPLSLDEMRLLWVALAKALPDLEHPAPPMSLPMAEGFREKQKRMFQDE